MSIKERSYQVIRKSMTQAFAYGIFSFLMPGLWTTLAILGAGGLETTYTANVANAALFAIMTVLAPFSAVLVNIIGFRKSVLIGSLGYTIYSAGLYQNSKAGTQWLIMFGAVTCAISAAQFWAVEAASTMVLPSAEERGVYLGIWQFVNKFGLIIGGAITLALNVNDSVEGSVSLSTYIVFFSLQCGGVLIVWLIVEPKDVIRGDGTSPRSNVVNETVKDRFIKFKNIALRKEVFLLAPLAIVIQWFETWQGNYMTVYFSVRARSLNTLVTAFVQMAADLIVGYLLDSKRWNTKTKLKWSWHIINVLMTAFFIYGFIMEGIYRKHPVEGLDWSDKNFSRGFVPFLLFKAFGEALNLWIYYLIGTMNFHATEASYVIAVIRGLEAFGEMWAFVVGAVNSSQMVNLAVSAGVYWVVVPSVTYVVHYVAIPAAEANLERNKELDAIYYKDEPIEDSNSETNIVPVNETVSEKEVSV